MEKRNKLNEGNIVLSKDGTYNVRLVYLASDGTRKDRRKKATTREEAETYLAQFKKEAKQAKKATTAGVEKITIEDYVTNYFLPWKLKYLKPQSYRRLESTFTHYIFNKHGKITLTKLKTKQIDSFIEELHKAGLSHSTVKKVHDAYKGLYKFAVNVKKDIHPEDNPTTGIMMIPEKKFVRNEIKWFTEEDIYSFAVEASRKYKTGLPVYKYGSVFLFVLNTGLREGELRALNKADIDLEERIMLINKSVNVVTEKLPDGSNLYRKEITTPKTMNSIRYVPLNDEAVKYAKEINQIFSEEDLFVYNGNGNLLDPGTLHKQFKMILRNAGLEERGLHTLRHGFVSALYKSGTDVMTIAEIIGDTPETVRKTYLHIDKATKMKAVQITNVTEIKEPLQLCTN